MRAFVTVSVLAAAAVLYREAAALGASHARRAVPVRANGSPPHAAVAPGTSYEATVLADRPVAFYPLDETAGTRAHDVSGHGRDARYVSVVKLGGAPLLAGRASSRSASFPHGYASAHLGWRAPAVTAECWIEPAASDLTGDSRIIENAWTDHSGNGFMLWLTNGTAAFNTGWLGVNGDAPLIPGRVYYVAATYDATAGSTLYVNGRAERSDAPGPSAHPERSDAGLTYIGALDARAGGFGFTDYFAGSISDCALYDRALPASSIAAHYNAGAHAHVVALATPGAPPSPTAPPPTPLPPPLVYDAQRACIGGKLYRNDVLPRGEGEFQTSGLDRAWWGRLRGNTVGGHRYSGFQVSWGRYQYDTYFGDDEDGVSKPGDDPFYVGNDLDAPGRPRGVRISAFPMPAHLVGNPKVDGATYYSGVLDTPVDQRFGFFVARLRLPVPKPGMSPAFWMLSNDGVPSGAHGPHNGEWDIQEMFGNDLGNGLNSGNFFWNSGAKTPQTWGGPYPWPPAGFTENSTPSSDYHDYGVLLSPGGARVLANDYGPGGPGNVYGPWRTGATAFLDGLPLPGHTGGADTTSGQSWKEVMAMFQVGPKTGWLGSPDPANFPASYWIQWIRVYRPTNATC